jgi:hypothetical protein
MTDDPSPDTGPKSSERLESVLPGDEHFKQSLANLSRRLSERSAKQASPEARAAAEKRRADLLAQDLAGTRRQSVHPTTDEGLEKVRRGDELFKQSLASLSQRLRERMVERASPDAHASADTRRAPLVKIDLERIRRTLVAVMGAAARRCVTFVGGAVARFDRTADLLTQGLAHAGRLLIGVMSATARRSRSCLGAAAAFLGNAGVSLAQGLAHAGRKLVRVMGTAARRSRSCLGGAAAFLGNAAALLAQGLARTQKLLVWMMNAAVQRCSSCVRGTVAFFDRAAALLIQSLAHTSRVLVWLVFGAARLCTACVGGAVALFDRAAALPAYDFARARRMLVWMMGGAGATVAAGCVAWIIVLIGAPAVPTPSVVQAPSAPAHTALAQAELAPPTTAAIGEASAGVPGAIGRTSFQQPPTAAANVSTPRPPTMQPFAPSSQAARAAPVEHPAIVTGPAIGKPGLPPVEVREIQTRLQGFGFSPGPIDGAAGPKTQEAAMRYRQSRGVADTGTVDRQLLEALRGDRVPPLPPPTQVAQRRAPPPPPPSAQPSSPLLASIKSASDRLGQWLNSIGR